MRRKAVLSVVLILALLLFVTSFGEAFTEPVSTGDGIIPYAQLLRLIRWIDDDYALNALYGDVAAFAGADGKDEGNNGPNSMTALGDHYFRWTAEEDDMAYIRVCFRGREDTGRFECCQWQTNKIRSEEWASADLSDYVIASACRETTAVSNQIQRFSNPAVTVDAAIPVRGWSERKWGDNEIRFCNERGYENDWPYIAVTVYDVPTMFDFYADKYENIQEIPSRTLAGIDMSGRAFRYMNRDWTEYTATLTDNVSIRVMYWGLYDEAGTETDDLLNSLQFHFAGTDGQEYAYSMPVPENEPAEPASASAAAEPVQTSAEPAAPAETAVPAAGPALPASDGFIPEQLYSAKTFITEGVSMDAGVMGTYAITFHTDGTCTFTVAGAEIPGITWTEQNGIAVVDYFGQALSFTPSEEGLNMDFFGSGTLLFTAE